MSVLLFLLASGDALPIGLGLIGLGAVLGLAYATPGASLGLAGLALALASSVPLPPIVYGTLALAVTVWLVCLRRTRPIRRTSASSLLVLVVFVSMVAAHQYPSPSGLPSDQRPVFVLGDSLSAGLGGPGETWPAVLANRLGRPVHNLARPGARLADGLAQASALPPGGCVVLIELGGNDLLGGVAVETFAASQRRLLGELTAEGRSLVMFELPLLPLQNRYGRVQRQVSSEFGVRLIPRRVLAGAVTLSGHTTDGLHLSAAGHAWLAERVAGWL